MPTCPKCRTNYPDGVATCAADGEALLEDEAFSNADAPLKAGDAVGEYRLDQKLGEGGFGAVYRATHPIIGKVAAVKVLNRAYSSDPQIVSRFIAEARAVNHIRHKNIIDIFSFGKLDDGRQFFVMELLEGRSLEDHLRKQGRLPISEALPILRAIARAIDAAHAGGIAHRDLKPDNVFLSRDADGRLLVKLLDFGIAKLFDGSGLAHKTRTGAPIGTPDYMSPEQCRGEEVDRRTDIYSFGVLVFRALTGKLPFIAKSVIELLYLHLNVPPPSATSQNPDLPPELDAVVASMLAKDPEDRPPTMEAAVDALAEAAKQAGVTVPVSTDLAVPWPAPSNPSSGGSSGAGVRTGSNRVSGDEADSLVQSKTIAAPSDSSPSRGPGSASLIGSEHDVAKPREKAPLALIFALAGVVGVALALAYVLVTQTKPLAASSSTASSTAAAATGSALASSTPQVSIAADTTLPVASATASLGATSAVAAGEPAVSATASVKASASTSARATTVRPHVVRPATAKPEWEDPFRDK